MHGPINVKSRINIGKWQMGFNSAFKELTSFIAVTLFILVELAQKGLEGNSTIDIDRHLAQFIPEDIRNLNWRASAGTAGSFETSRLRGRPSTHRLSCEELLPLHVQRRSRQTLGPLRNISSRNQLK
jgi:hypothetical protein